MEGNFSGNFSHGSLELVRVCGSFQSSRVREIGGKIRCCSEANPREATTGSSYREVRETEGSRHRDFTAYYTCDIGQFFLNVLSNFASLDFG